MNGVHQIYATLDATFYNENGDAVAIGEGSDGRFIISALSRDRGGSYALVSRSEMQQISDAIAQHLTSKAKSE